VSRVGQGGYTPEKDGMPVRDTLTWVVPNHLVGCLGLDWHAVQELRHQPGDCFHVPIEYLALCNLLSDCSCSFYTLTSCIHICVLSIITSVQVVHESYVEVIGNSPKSLLFLVDLPAQLDDYPLALHLEQQEGALHSSVPQKWSLLHSG
jgi:hypothetical protein